MRFLTACTAAASLLLLAGCSLLPDSWGGGVQHGDSQTCPAPEEGDHVNADDVPPPSLDDAFEPDSLQVSDDGTQLAGLFGNQILLWDAQAGGAPSKTIGEATYLWSSALTASPDFSQFAFLADSDTVRLVTSDGNSEDLESGVWHENETLRALDISPDGQRLAVRGSSGLIAVHSLPGLELEMTLGACQAGFGDITFSPDSSLLFAEGRAPAQVWDLETYEPVFEIETEGLRYRRAAWSHDESVLALSARRITTDFESNLTLVDTAQWEVSDTYSQFTPISIDFLPEDDELLITPGGVNLVLWPIDGTPREMPTDKPTNNPARLSPDGTTAYFAGQGYGEEPDYLVSFDLEAEEHNLTFDVPDVECESLTDPDIVQECS